VRLCGMRNGIIIDVTPADRARLQSITRDRNSPQKHVWRAQIIVLSADGKGTTAITRAVGKGKTVVWRWQERFMHEGVEGLTHDKTRPSRIPPLPAAIVDRFNGKICRCRRRGTGDSVLGHIGHIAYLYVFRDDGWYASDCAALSGRDAQETDEIPWVRLKLGLLKDIVAFAPELAPLASRYIEGLPREVYREELKEAEPEVAAAAVQHHASTEAEGDASEIAEEIAAAEKEFGRPLSSAEKRLVVTLVKIEELKEQSGAAVIGFGEPEKGGAA
jgi:hypothetical protein